MRALLYSLSLTAVVLAWATARRRPEHHAVAGLLSISLFTDVLALALHRWVLPPPLLDVPPLTGWVRLAGDVDTALYLAWPFGIAAVALHTLSGRSMWPAVLGYLVTVTGLAIGYPTIRGELLRQVLLAAELTALFVGFACVIAWWRRREPSTVTTLCTSILVVGHFATVISGPYRLGLFGEAWKLAQVGYVLIYAVLILLQAGSLWEHRGS